MRMRRVVMVSWWEAEVEGLAAVQGDEVDD